MNSPVAAPVSEVEADTLFLPLLNCRTVYLAVSGGVDSSALLHLVAGWHLRHGHRDQRIVVLTVDHQLRPQSAVEAAAVAANAAKLGFAHRTLVWCGAKPVAGLQEAARNARYRLMARQIISESTGAACSIALVTAHTADDQSETLLMRLQRGSGVEGLASIRAVSTMECQSEEGRPIRLPLYRPLLPVEHSRLIATLDAAGIGYFDDPSNLNTHFERVRVRQGLIHLRELGFTHAGLGRSVRRLQSAQAALEVFTDRLISSSLRHVHGCAFEIDLDAVLCEPDEIGIRLLRRVIDRAGGSARRAELAKVEAAYLRLTKGNPRLIAASTFTLGGAVIEPFYQKGTGRRHIWVYREPDRSGGLDAVIMGPGDALNWDNRFLASVRSGYPGTVEIGPLRAGWQALMAEHPCLAGLPIPSAAARSLPAFRVGAQVIAVPTLATFARDHGDMAAWAALAGPLSDHSQASPPLLTADVNACLQSQMLDELS